MMETKDDRYGRTYAWLPDFLHLAIQRGIGFKTVDKQHSFFYIVLFLFSILATVSYMEGWTTITETLLAGCVFFLGCILEFLERIYMRMIPERG